MSPDHAGADHRTPSIGTAPGWWARSNPGDPDVRGVAILYLNRIYIQALHADSDVPSRQTSYFNRDAGRAGRVSLVRCAIKIGRRPVSPVYL